MTTRVAAHTPGPWNYEAIPRDAYSDVDLTISESSKFWIVESRDAGEVLALVEDSSRHDAEARARLIAAAPELVEALKAALAEMQNWVDEHEGKDPFGLVCGCCDGAIPIPHSLGCNIRAALAKAGALWLHCSSC